MEKMEKPPKIKATTSQILQTNEQGSTPAEPVRSGSNTSRNLRLKILSCNVNGLKDKEKNELFIDSLHNLQANICFLQETHLESSEILDITNYTEYLSSFNTRSSGVAILIKKTLKFELKKKISDKNGRCIIVHGTLNGTPLTLVSIYGPTKDDPIFFENVFLTLKRFKNIIIGGDWNTDMIPSIDRSSGRQRNPKSANMIRYFMENRKFLDIWRMKNRDVIQYTHTSKRHQTHSRIDYFLIQESLKNFTEGTIHNMKISDHSIISLTIQFGPEQNISQ